MKSVFYFLVETTSKHHSHLCTVHHAIVPCYPQHNRILVRQNHMSTSIFLILSDFIASKSMQGWRAAKITTALESKSIGPIWSGASLYLKRWCDRWHVSRKRRDHMFFFAIIHLFNKKISKAETPCLKKGIRFSMTESWHSWSKMHQLPFKCQTVIFSIHQPM